MTTTTSFFNKDQIFQAYKNALKSIRGLSIFYTILSLLSFPVVYFVQTMSDRGNAVTRGTLTVEYQLIGWAKIYPKFTVIAYFAFLIVMVVFIGVMVNRFMHSKTAVDVYHSLPITRTALLISNYLAAATAVILPMVLCFGIVMLGNLTVQTATTADIFISLVRLIILVLATLSLTFLCCVACCAVFDSAAFSLALGIVIPCFSILRDVTFALMLVGHSSRDIIDIASFIYSPSFMIFSEAIPKNYAMSQSLSRDMFSNPMIYFGYAVFAMVALALACLVYKKRKSELAQSFDISGAIYQLLLVASSVGLGITLAVFTNFEFMRGSAGLVMILMSAVYSGASYVIFSAILSHSFKQTKRSITTFGVCVALPIIFLASLLYTGGFGYASYTPSINDIESVSVNYMGSYADIGYTEKSDRFTPTTKFCEQEGISAVIDVHKAVSTDIIYSQKAGLDSVISGMTYRDLYVDYTLKNGKRITRSYVGVISLETSEMIDVLESNPEFKAQHSPFQLSNSETVKTFEIVDGYGDNFQTLNLTKEQKEKLYIAMQVDDKNTDYQEKMKAKGEVYCRISVIYNNVETDFGEMPKYGGVSMAVTEKQSSTIKVLKEIGLEQYAAPASMENKRAMVIGCVGMYSSSVNPSYLSLDCFESQNYYRAHNVMMMSRGFEKSWLTYQGEELKQILPQLQRYAYVAGDQEKITYMVLLVDIDTEIGSEDPAELYRSAHFMSYENAPQFVRDAFAKQ